MAFNPAPDDAHKELPVQNEPVVVAENPAVKQMAVQKAKSNLKQKNRKNNEFTVEMPLRLDFYSATLGKLTGFTPVADDQNWVLGEMTLKFNGKQGSNTILVFYPTNTQITGE